MPLVITSSLLGWSRTKRRRRRMACVRGEVSLNSHAMDWQSLGSCSTMSCSSCWNYSWVVLMQFSFLFPWNCLCTDWLHKELGADQDWWWPSPYSFAFHLLGRLWNRDCFYPGWIREHWAREFWKSKIIHPQDDDNTVWEVLWGTILCSHSSAAWKNVLCFI